MSAWAGHSGPWSSWPYINQYEFAADDAGAPSAARSVVQVAGGASDEELSSPFDRPLMQPPGKRCNQTKALMLLGLGTAGSKIRWCGHRCHRVQLPSLQGYAFADGVRQAVTASQGPTLETPDQALGSPCSFTVTVAPGARFICTLCS